jgi:cell division protein FtsN
MKIMQFKKQAGGTLLGLIIGLIIGLGIAVVVAVTIKNTPLPFINKLGKPDSRPDPAAGQVSDPNKPLYGNGNASKEAAKEFARRAEEEKAAKDALSGNKDEPAADAKSDAKPPKAESKGDAKADAKAGSENKAPVVERSTPEKSAAAKTDKSQKADNADEKFTYFLQAGAFREQADAENAKAKLALLGVSASVAERQSENGTLYRVRIGPFGQLETMNRMRSRLTDNGVDVAVVRVPK